MQAHGQAECQYTSAFEQPSNEFEADLEQHQACKFSSYCEPNSSTFVEYSRDRYSCKFYNQFENQVKPMITYYCIGNYIFLAEHNLCHSNTAL